MASLHALMLKGPHKIQGIGAGFLPAVLDVNILDEVIQVSLYLTIKHFVHVLITRNDALEKSIEHFNANRDISRGLKDDPSHDELITFMKIWQLRIKYAFVVLPSFRERYLSTVLFDSLQEEAENMTFD
ncbi:O-acetylserine (thiol) lyase (OAS-TL) isoform A2 [Forsythia ovata]|uniref:O-acetylserine (Thiol) lyase (OAS-TL) isoform A2 n=1 Tax=Forsythia ovata TaxID=205694 RepID=A0ABD1VQH7_9LAMI